MNTQNFGQLPIGESIVTCKRCGRRLRKPEHRAIGYGPVCAKKLGLLRVSKDIAPTFLKYGLKSLNAFPNDPKHPYWVTGYDSSDNALVVTFVKSQSELFKLWPEAFDLEGPEAMGEAKMIEEKKALCFHFGGSTNVSAGTL